MDAATDSSRGCACSLTRLVGLCVCNDAKKKKKHKPKTNPATSHMQCTFFGTWIETSAPTQAGPALRAGGPVQAAPVHVPASEHAVLLRAPGDASPGAPHACRRCLSSHAGLCLSVCEVDELCSVSTARHKKAGRLLRSSARATSAEGRAWARGAAHLAIIRVARVALSQRQPRVRPAGETLNSKVQLSSPLALKHGQHSVTTAPPGGAPAVDLHRAWATPGLTCWWPPTAQAPTRHRRSRQPSTAPARPAHVPAMRAQAAAHQPGGSGSWPCSSSIQFRSPP